MKFSGTQNWSQEACLLARNFQPRGAKVMGSPSRKVGPMPALPHIVELNALEESRNINSCKWLHFNENRWN